MLDVPSPATGVTAGTVPGGGGWDDPLPLGSLPKNWARCTPHRTSGSRKDILEPRLRVRNDAIFIGAV